MLCQFCAKLRKLFELNWLGVTARKLTNQPVLVDLRILKSYCRERFWIHNPKVGGSIPRVATKSHGRTQNISIIHNRARLISSCSYYTSRQSLFEIIFLNRLPFPLIPQYPKRSKVESHLPSQSLDRRRFQQAGNFEQGSVTVSVAVWLDCVPVFSHKYHYMVLYCVS
jgi:hypothetical protein